MKALSIMQPWAELIVAGHKDIENRTWKTNVRGQILIHASQKFDMHGWAYIHSNWWKLGLPCSVGDLLDSLKPGDYKRGGIVGQAEIIDCVATHASPWKVEEQYGFVLANAKRLDFYPLKGQLGFYEVDLPA